MNINEQTLSRNLNALGYNDSEAEEISTALQSVKETYPALKRQKVEALCPAPSQVGNASQCGASNSKYTELFYMSSGWLDWTKPSLTTSFRG